MLINCLDPNDYSEVTAAIERAVGNCTITYAKQHQEMVAAGKSKSIRESARIIAAESDETSQAVRRKIQKGLTKVAPVGPSKSKPIETIANTTLGKRQPQGGGARENAGRPKQYKLSPSGTSFVPDESTPAAPVVSTVPAEIASLSVPDKPTTQVTSEISVDTAPEQKSKPVKKEKPKFIHTETHPVTVAVQVANIIISQLDRIKEADYKKEEAFQLIIDRINKVMKGKQYVLRPENK